MQPEVVAHTLMEVESKWKNEITAFLECNSSSPKKPSLCAMPERVFQRSCTSVMGVVVKASAGERSVVKEYMQNVCGEPVLQAWAKDSCLSFSSALDEGMTDDSYTNREDLNLTTSCTNLWQLLAQGEAKRIAKEAEERAIYEKKMAQEQAEAERKAAEAQAAAEKRAMEERKEAEKKAAEEAEKKAEEEAKKKTEEAKNKAAEAARQAAEAKKKAEDAAAKLKLQHELQHKTTTHKANEPKEAKAVQVQGVSQTTAAQKNVDAKSHDTKQRSEQPKEVKANAAAAKVKVAPAAANATKAAVGTPSPKPGATSKAAATTPAAHKTSKK